MKTVYCEICHDELVVPDWHTYCECYYKQYKENMSEKIKCECGRTITVGSKNEHLKSLIHQEYLKLKSENKLNDEMNKTFKCECGSNITNLTKEKHLNTMVHKKYLLKNCGPNDEIMKLKEKYQCECGIIINDLMKDSHNKTSHHKGYMYRKNKK
jgi:hypothetical protein